MPIAGSGTTAWKIAEQAADTVPPPARVAGTDWQGSPANCAVKMPVGFVTLPSFRAVTVPLTPKKSVLLSPASTGFSAGS